MAYELLGKNFTPPDVIGKVTGAAKYANDFQVDGMTHARLLVSPMPHGRVTRLDASRALAMDGVLAVLTADDLPPVGGATEPILTNEPLHVGAPVAAVVAESELLASDALDRIDLELEPLAFTVDPLDALRPHGPSARSDGNAIAGGFEAEVIAQRWTAADFAAAGPGQLPMGTPTREWRYGDIEAGFDESALVLDESFVVGSNSHHSMEPRSALAWWENGKCHVHGSTQSQTWVVPGLARLIGIDPDDLVYVAEYCGGGFGSKGSAYPVMAIPALLARRIGRPVMLRVSREEEYSLGRARSGFQGRVKLGFATNGRLLAVDVYLVKDSGPHSGFPDIEGAGLALSLVYQPEAMRLRGISPNTNTPPRAAQRGPGQNQMAVTIEPLIDRAARELGIDRLAIRLLNAADGNARAGENRQHVTSAYQREVLEKGAARFRWAERLAGSGQRDGSKVRTVAVGQAFHPAGFNGFDGLVRITPDGVLHIHSGVGNLGTYSYAATSRVVAEVLRCEWSRCVIERGDTRKGLPFNIGQFGSNTSFTMTRSNYVAAMDAVDKLKQIAARELGGESADYDIGGERVFLAMDPNVGMTYAAAASRAIELGGAFSGETVPDDVNPLTKSAAAIVAGTGLVGVARDDLHRDGLVPAFAAGFVEIELDLETGKLSLLDYLGVADCGTVLHPQSLATQIKGGAVMGIGMALFEHMVYDPQIGLPANVGFHQARIPSYLDVPTAMASDAVDLPDPQNPVGAKGVGEPLLGCAGAAVLCAISEALGGHLFLRTPVHTDMIVNAALGLPQSHDPLAVHTQ
jgi:xanthine dehydrogenase molybdenum-binding subunit